MTSHTITALKRWSCHDKQLPPVDQIKAIHIYDFDNTCKLLGYRKTALAPRLIQNSIRIAPSEQAGLEQRNIWSTAGARISAQWRLVA